MVIKQKTIIFFQLVAAAILGLNLLGLVSPANSLSLISGFGPLALSTICVLAFVGLFRKTSLESFRLATLFLLMLLVAGLYQLFFESGVFAWYMLAFLFLLSFIFFVENFIQEKCLVAGWVFIFFNLLILVYLFIDQRVYLVTKTHVTYKLILELSKVAALVVDSSKHTGQHLLEVLLQTFWFCLLPFAGLLNRAGKIVENRMTKTFVLVSAILFFLHLQTFSFVCSKVPLVYYLPIRLELGCLPIPDHPVLNKEKELKSLLHQQIEIDESKIYPELSFSLGEKAELPENIIIVLLESVRLKEFENLMPFCHNMAGQGIKFIEHYSVSNISASSFPSIFNSSFPINHSFRSIGEKTEIKFHTFLKEQGYQTYLLKRFPRFPLGFNWGDTKIEPETPDKGRDAEIILEKTINLLKEPGKKAIVMYFFNTHFNYYYPPEYELYKPVLNKNSNLFLTEPNPENVEKVRNRYKNAVSYVDDKLAEFFQKIKDESIFSKSIVLLMADHGESLGEAGFFAHSTGPHVNQFAVPTFIVGDKIEARIVKGPTTHADIMPILAEQMGLKIENAWGKSLKAKRSYPLLQIDESVTGRLIVRHEKFMSLFDLSLSGELSWLATIANNFTINQSVAKFYTDKSLKTLKKQIRKDVEFIKNSLQ